MKTITNRSSLAIALIFAPIALLTGLVYHVTKKDNPQFQFYEPTVLPSGLKIESQKEVRWNWNDGTKEKYTEFDTILNKEEVTISQSKRTKESDRALKCEKINNEICKDINTPKGKSYTQISTLDETNSVSSLALHFVKDDTYIWLTIDANNDLGKDYAKQDWGPTLDSFQPIPRDKTIPIEYKSYGP